MTPVCGICGEPMPTGEEMFKFHGYSGPCPKPPMSAPRPEGMSEEDLKRLAKVAKDADDAVSGPWSMDDHIVKPGDTPDQWHVYEQLEDDPPFATVDDPRLALHIATFDPPLCEALLAEVSRLRADGATLRERVRKLPSPLSWHAADSDGEGCEAHIYCAWCGHNTPADSLRRNSLHHGTCLYAELASAPKEPTP